MTSCVIALGLFDGIEVGALEIFDQRQLHGLLVVGLDHDDRNLVETCEPGCAPAALTGDDLIEAGRQLPHGQRLDNAVHGDGVGQRLQFVRVKAFARLERIRLHLLQRQKLRTGGRLRRLHGRFAEKRAQPLAEATLFRHKIRSLFRNFSAFSRFPPPETDTPAHRG